MTPDEHLKEEIGRIVTHYLFQNALLRSELDAMKAKYESGGQAVDLNGQPAQR